MTTPTIPVTVSYTYEAVRAHGAMERGSIAASSRAAAVSMLHARGLFPLDVKITPPSESRRAHLSPADLALGLRILASLLESGLPVGRALSALEGPAPVSWKHLLPQIRTAVGEGRSLAAALEGLPVKMPSLVIGIIRAGESGSGLSAAVQRAARVTEAAATRRAMLRDALAYPAILAVTGTGSLTILVVVVLPRFAAILADLGQQLPLSTRVIMSAAEQFRLWALPIFLLAVVVAVVFRSWKATESGGVRWHRWLLDLPGLGEFRRATITAHLSTTLRALLDSGVPIATAMHYAGQSSDDRAAFVELRHARERIVGGERLSAALDGTTVISNTAVRLIRAGEESGRLPDMLEHAGRIESERAERMAKNALRALEPALIVAFGLIVAGVAAALLQAVYAVRPT